MGDTGMRWVRSKDLTHSGLNYTTMILYGMLSVVALRLRNLIMGKSGRETNNVRIYFN